MNQIRVLQVVTSYQSVVTILDSKLRLLGRQNNVVCHVASSGDSAERRNAAVPHIAVQIPRSVRPWQDLRAVVRLCRIIRKNGYDIVHTHTAKAGMVGAIAGWLAGTPTVHTYHGLPFFSTQNRISHALYKLLETIACRFRSAVLSQNKADFNTLKSMKSIRCPVYFEGNGIDPWHIRQNALESCKSVEHIFSKGKTRILCVARLEPVKHLETVLEAVRFLNMSGLPSECVIAGKGPLQEDLERLIVAKNLENSVRIVYSPFVHSLIDQSDIGVLSSEKEGIPRGLMEAMALRKPVLATDVLGTNELVVNGKTGILVPFGDQNAFNRALQTLVLEKNLRESYGEAGYERVLEHFSERRIVGLWMDVYGKILGLPVASR